MHKPTYIFISAYSKVHSLFQTWTNLQIPKEVQGLGNSSVNREPRILLTKNICNQPPKWVITYVTECETSKSKKWQIHLFLKNQNIILKNLLLTYLPSSKIRNLCFHCNSWCYCKLLSHLKNLPPDFRCFFFNNFLIKNFTDNPKLRVIRTMFLDFSPLSCVFICL